MRTVDRPFTIVARDGVVHFECDGATVSFEPSVARRAGDHFVKRAVAAQREFGAKLRQCAVRTGERLIEGAAEATRQATAAEKIVLPVATPAKSAPTPLATAAL